MSDTLRMLSETLLGDYAALDPVYVDGIAGVFNLGPNFSTVFFRYNPVRTDNGIIVYERTPTMLLIQPRSTLVCGRGCQINAMLEAQQAPSILPEGAQSATLN
jgi:hypothetical protein